MSVHTKRYLKAAALSFFSICVLALALLIAMTADHAGLQGEAMLASNLHIAAWILGACGFGLFALAAFTDI